MALIRNKQMVKETDDGRVVDFTTKLLDGAIEAKNDVKKTMLSRLHGIKTQVTYYEQVVSDRQGNFVNTSPLNDFDPNTQKYRKITNFVILTQELDPNMDKDVFANLTYEGTATILPNTVIPNISDHFVMRVFEQYHIFRVVEINPTLVEKDSGYEIRFEMYAQDVNPMNIDLDSKIKDRYTFDYNHVGTEFRTIFRNDEYEFISNSRDMMTHIMEIYTGAFYHKTFNTIMCSVTNINTIKYLELKTQYLDPANVPLRYSNDPLDQYIMATTPNTMPNIIGEEKSKPRSFYDPDLVKFMNKFNLFSVCEYLHVVTEYIESDKKIYRNSIFSALEHCDKTRFKLKQHKISFSNYNSYNITNKLYGRFILEATDLTQDLSLDNIAQILPADLVDKIVNYDSNIVYNSVPTYTNPNYCLMDIISAFICETDELRKRTIIIKLLNILIKDHYSHLYDEEYDNSIDIFYTYPLFVYVLKYMIREISLIEFK